MTDFPFDIVAFDLDGTLLDTHEDLGASVNHALGEGGFREVPVGSAKDLIGGGAKTMLARALEDQGGVPDDEFRRLYKLMLAHYAEHNAVLTKPYPHAESVLDELAGRGVKLAVVTNKFESFARGVLQTLGLAQRFACIIGGDTLGKGRAKPAPDPLYETIRLCGGGRLVFVGDSSYDLHAARAAGVPFVAACYGYCDLAREDFAADAAIDTLDQLIPALERL